MHYVICYDLENDRLREKVAKLLRRHGCNRVQKSVFVAPDLSARHRDLLLAATARLLARNPAQPQDNLLLIPLPDECARLSNALAGPNNLLAGIAEMPVKLLL